MKAWIPTEILEQIKADPIRTYLLIKMLVQNYAPIKEMEVPEGQAVDYVIKGMMDEMKRQYPKIEKASPPKPEEIN